MISPHLVRSILPARTLALAGALCLAVSLTGSPAQAAEATVDLGTAGSFAVLAGQSVTNTGDSVITGDIGVSPGTSMTGFASTVPTDGARHVADAVALQAQSDLTTAYGSAAGRSTVTDVTGKDLGGQTFTSGVVEHTSGMHLTGTVTLDAQGDPAAVFIFKAGSTLVTASGSTVSLINGASPCNVFWQVGSSATLGTDTTFVGTVMALTSASLATRASVQGRVLARNGSITLDTNVITRPGCTAGGASTPPSETPTTATSTATPTATPTTSPTTSTPTSSTPTTSTPTASTSPSSSTPASPSTSPSKASGGSGSDGGSDGDSGSRDDGSSDDGSSDDGSSDDGSSDSGGGGGDGQTPVTSSTPVVPTGHPETGLGGGSQPGGPGWALLALLAGLAAASASLRWRRARPVSVR